MPYHRAPAYGTTTTTGTEPPSTRRTRASRPDQREAFALRIYVDADSCPVKDEVYRVAKRYEIEVTLVSESWLRIPAEPWIRLEVVEETGGLDAADDWIAERAGSGDIVVTDDIVLASRCVKNGCSVLSTRGRAFTSASIGDALADRELMANLREAGAVTGGPSRFTKSDRSAFLQQLDNAIVALKMRSSNERGA